MYLEVCKEIDQALLNWGKSYLGSSKCLTNRMSCDHLRHLLLHSLVSSPIAPTFPSSTSVLLDQFAWIWSYEFEEMKMSAPQTTYDVAISILKIFPGASRGLSGFDILV